MVPNVVDRVHAEEHNIVVRRLQVSDDPYFTPTILINGVTYPNPGVVLSDKKAEYWYTMFLDGLLGLGGFRRNLDNFFERLRLSASPLRLELGRFGALVGALWAMDLIPKAQAAAWNQALTTAMDKNDLDGVMNVIGGIRLKLCADFPFLHQCGEPQNVQVRSTSQ